jgi:subtilisin family serine protease
MSASLSPQAEQMAQRLAEAAKRSPEALQEVLAGVESPNQARTLQSAFDYLTDNQLLDSRSAELIQARIDALGAAQTAASGAKTGGSFFGNRLVQAGLVVAGVGGIAAAAGGGGGGGGGSPQPSPPPSEEPVPEPVDPTFPEEDETILPTPAPAPEPAHISRPTSAEYRFTGGMDITGIEAAHARGYTGSSAVVAALDTGFFSDHVELSGQFSGFYNAYTGSELAADAIDVDGHGTHVAGIIAAKANDYMGVGYAPDTSLLGVRIGDSEGRLTTNSEQTAGAFRWAREHGADFINNSWGPSAHASDFTAEQVEPFISAELTEFRTGAQNDVIYIWANGNDGGGQPSLYAALPQLFPELKDNWVAVANIDSATGELHPSSQACGDARDWCISAPGTNISAPSILGSEYYAIMTGTSMAAPAVTGALAVLKDAFPMLTNEQIVSRLFFTADKSGVYANMALYGQGLMDVDAATTPIGTLSVVGASGESTPLAITSMRMGSAFGTSNPLQGVKVMALDSQGAGFITDLGGVVQTGDYQQDLVAGTERFARQAPRQIDGGNGMTLTLGYAWSDASQADNMVLGFTSNDGMATRFGMVSNADVLAGGISFAGLSQQRVSFAAPYWMSENDESAVGLQQGFSFAGGNLSFTAMSSAERSGAAASYSYNLIDAYTSTLEFGLVKGKDSLFGTETGGALDFGDKATTRFVGVRGEYRRNVLTLFHSAYMGHSDVSASGLINGVDTVTTSSWVVGGQYDQGIQQFGLLVAQPLKVESADASLSFINGYQNGAFTTGTVDVDLRPSGRQINTELYFATSSRTVDDIKFSLMRMDQSGHNARAKADHVATLSLGAHF